MQTRDIPAPSPASLQAGERLLVCIAPNPVNEKLVRTGYALARSLNAEWFVIHIETPDQAHLSEAERTQVTQALRLGEELGAKCLVLPGMRAAETILQFARASGITKIITGKPTRGRWSELLRGGSVINQLIRSSASIDVYIINEKTTFPQKAVLTTWIPHRPLGRYLFSLGLVFLVTLTGFPLSRFLEPTNLVMLYLLAVLISAVFLGRGPSILASFVSVLAFDFFFIEPKLTFVVNDTQYILTFIGLFMVGLVISALTAQLTGQTRAANERAVQATASYELSQALAAAQTIEEITRALVLRTTQTFNCAAAVFLCGRPVDEPEGVSPDFLSSLSEQDISAVRWVMDHNLPAGKGSQIFTKANAFYIPLKAPQEMVGVLGIRLAGEEPIHPEHRRLLETFSSQTALALERVSLVEKARQAQLARETEALQTALLNSISHDLRTPLASITGAISSLRDRTVHLDDATREDILENAWGETDRMNRLVGNLLDMTRLESGAMHVTRTPRDLGEVIEAALNGLGERLDDRPLSLRLDPYLPPVPADFTLLLQVFLNLLDNALKYSPPGTPLEIDAAQRGEQVEIRVSDRGIGIPVADLERVFDKFYRVQRNNGVSGTGLGLAICKGIIEAHGGQIWAALRSPGEGTEMHIRLPLALSDGGAGGSG